MKSEMIDLKQSEKKYPYLGKSTKSDLVVLFITKYSGTVVNVSGTFELGWYSESWTESLFELFTGTIKLSN